MDTVPTMIDEWYTRAIHFKTQWDKADAIASRKPYNPYPVQRNHTNHQNPKVNPYTMDVNSLWIKKNSPKKKARNASERATAFDAENPDITQEIVPLTPTQKLHQEKSQEPRKVAKIEEILEVQQGEEVSDEEELIAKLYVQDF